MLPAAVRALSELELYPSQRSGINFGRVMELRYKLERLMEDTQALQQKVQQLTRENQECQEEKETLCRKIMGLEAQQKCADFLITQCAERGVLLG